MNKLRVDIPFFYLACYFADPFGIKGNIFTLHSINVQTYLYKTWHLKGGRTQVSINPPTKPIKIFVKKKQLIASPYQIG